jgi:hypothetical protein
MWIRTDNGIVPLSLSGSTGSTPTLAQVLNSGNVSFNDIVITSGNTIQYQGINTGSTTTILGLDASGNTITTSVAGATQDLDNVLSYGNSTGAYNIIVSSGQTIQYQGLSNGSSNTILALDTTGGTITTTITDGNTYITGGTITYTGSNGTLDLFDTSGNTISITGLTDIYTTGGTYSSSDGELSLTRNDGTTYTINGFFTGYTNLVETLTTGTGLSGDTTTGNVTIVNTAPDQVVSLSGGTAISTSGTYPNFTITNTAPDQVVGITGGTNISISGSYPNFTISATGITDNNRYTTGGTITYIGSNGTLDLFDNSGSTISITGLTDIYSTGGTYSNGTLTINRNDGNSFNVSGLFTGYTNVVNSLTAGTGLSGNTTTGNVTLINTAPDQTVVLNNGSNISVTGTYPNFTIAATGLTDYYVTGGTYSNGTLTLNRQNGSVNVSGLFTGYTSVVNSLTTGTGLSANTTNGNITILNSAPDQTVVLNSGTGISTSGTYPNFTITNTAPDQTITLSGGTGIITGGTYPNLTIRNTIVNGSFGITIDGGGSAITTGVKGYITIPYNCTITGWDIFSDISGSIVVDVWKDTYANFPPTVADTIAGSEKPTLSSATKNQDNNLTTWTTSVSSGDIIGFNVDSASTLTRVNLIIKVSKTS